MLALPDVLTPVAQWLGTRQGGSLAGLGTLALVGLVVAVWQWKRGRRLGRQLRATLHRAERLRGELHDLGVAGLTSRARFERALEATTRPDAPDAPDMVVLFLNLDNFRACNEAHGLAGGNEVLREAAQRIVNVLRESPAARHALAMRMGADEFVIGLPATLQVGCDLGLALVERMRGTMKLASGTPLMLSCSVGIAQFPEHGGGTRLVTHAAQAMQAVKRAGGDGCMVFEPQMAVDLKAQAELIADLRQAVARGELELWYQPKVDARGLQITAAEALLRWRHPRRGMVSPGTFIPIAERCGLIGAIGNWVIEEAARQAAVWRSQGLRMRVAINLSAYQMRQDDLVERIEEALARHRLSPNRFTVEITESVAMEDTQVTQRSFERMRAAGLHVSIDDFGVGQASLSYLRRLPAAELKIDASFVKDVASSVDARAIVDAVVKLAHALSLKVVAEGVETEAQRDALIELGCDELQGYLFAKPMTARAIATWAMMDADAPSPHTEGQARGFRPSLFQDSQSAPAAL